MSYFQESTAKKLISAPVIVSSFIGILVAVPLAFALQASMNVSALQQANQATAQVSADDFAKFAYAFNQGYEARVTSTSSSGGQAACAEVGVPVAADATQVNSLVAPTGGKGGGAVVAKMSDRTAAMVNSFNSYTSMVNNSSSVTNVNSNNTVGSNNTTRTDVNIERSLGVTVGVNNEQRSSQTNAEDSYNRGSYNTTNETSIINDSFKKDVDVTNTTTTTTDVDVSREVNVDNTRNVTNTDNSVVNNNSNNTIGIEVDAEVAVNSHNED